MIQSHGDKKKHQRADGQVRHPLRNFHRLHLPARAAQLAVDKLVVIDQFPGGDLEFGPFGAGPDSADAMPLATWNS